MYKIFYFLYNYNNHKKSIKIFLIIFPILTYYNSAFKGTLILIDTTPILNLFQYKFF